MKNLERQLEKMGLEWHSYLRYTNEEAKLNAVLPPLEKKGKLKMKDVITKKSSEDLLNRLLLQFGELRIKNRLKLEKFLETENSLDYLGENVLKPSIRVSVDIDELLEIRNKELMGFESNKKKKKKRYTIELDRLEMENKIFEIRSEKDEDKLNQLLPETYKEYKLKNMFGEAESLLRYIVLKKNQFPFTKEGIKLEETINGEIEQALYKDYYDKLKKEWAMTEEMHAKCIEINEGG